MDIPDFRALREFENFFTFSKRMCCRSIGGTILTQVKKFVKNQELIKGKVGHIELDQKSAMRISSVFDPHIAELLVSEMTTGLYL